MLGYSRGVLRGVGGAWVTAVRNAGSEHITRRQIENEPRKHARKSQNAPQIMMDNSIESLPLILNLVPIKKQTSSLYIPVKFKYYTQIIKPHQRYKGGVFCAIGCGYALNNSP